MRQISRQDITDSSCNDAVVEALQTVPRIEDVTIPTVCESNEFVMILNHDLLFSTVIRSMFTVFRCLIGDCNFPDGRPLAPTLMAQYGWIFTIGYIIVICFVLFGVFNLVMAIFVENTLESARVNQLKRQQARHMEHIRVAQELHKIVMLICRRRGASMNSDAVCEVLRGKSSFTNVRNRMSSLMFSTKPSNKGNRSSLDDEGDDETVETLQMNVTREVFEEVMEDPKVQAIMEDLEISVTSHEKLFDIIDSNGSGMLDIGELVEGLMKLRGPADKGDVVCAALMVRAMQKDLKRMEVELARRHKSLHAQQERLFEEMGSVRKLHEFQNENTSGSLKRV